MFSVKGMIFFNPTFFVPRNPTFFVFEKGGGQGPFLLSKRGGKDFFVFEKGG